MARPSVDAALHFLRVGLERGDLRDGDRLPTIVELARQARVSVVSMSKAVAALVHEGLLDARRGRGIVLSRDRAAPAFAARAPTTSERLANDIARKLLSGAYGPSHVVPSLKELQAYYGAGFRSVKRALDSLRQGGIVVAHGQGYRLRGPAPAATPKTLVFIVGREMHENLRWSYAKSFFYPLLYALERECSQRNVRLEVERYPWRMTELVRKPGTVAHFGRRGLTLARAPSIVSFNDQAEAFEHKLTSYNFNGPGLAAAVVSHALVPAALRRAQHARDPVVHVDGYLVDRGSLRTIAR